MHNIIKIGVAHADTFVRAGVKSIFESYEDFNFIGEAIDKSEAVRKFLNQSLDVLIVSASLSGGVIQLIKEISNAKIDLKVIVVGDFCEKSFLNKLLSCGVPGFISKCSSPNIIVSAVREVAKGKQVYINGATVKKRHCLLPEDANEKISILTRRESEVVQLIGEGQSNIEIAKALSISPSTVKNHLTKIYGKLQKKSRGELILYSVANIHFNYRT